MSQAAVMRERPALDRLLELYVLGSWGRRSAAPVWQAAFLCLAIGLSGFLGYEAVSKQITRTGLLHADRVSLVASTTSAS